MFFYLVPQVFENVSYRHLPKASSCDAVTGVGFMLSDSVLCLQSRFEDYTFCIAEDRYFYCVPFDKKLNGSF